MRLGLQLSNLTFPGGPARLGTDMANAARWAEDAGMDSVWLMDHFFQIPPIGPAEKDMLEGYSGLCFLAAHTKRVKLGTMVTGITYRHPGILVKTATTLDVLSGGRSWFGIGAAWFEREHEALGVPFPPLKERFERLEETIQIALQMWSSNNGEFVGKHYHLKETLCVPAPLTRPRPPILIGGSGEKKTLRLVAKYADACNLFGTPDVVEHKLNVLRQHCADLGRDYNAIEKTVLTTYMTNTPAFLAQLDAFARVGVDAVLFNLPDPSDQKAYDVIGKQLVPHAAQLQTAGR
jgi:F420-dependent oxidoreductase-like protein